jgi:hypothetical protein
MPGSPPPPTAVPVAIAPVAVVSVLSATACSAGEIGADDAGPVPCGGEDEPPGASHGSAYPASSASMRATSPSRTDGGAKTARAALRWQARNSALPHPN